MNILFLTYDFPYPTTSGGKNRAYHLLSYAKKKNNIFLFSFVRPDFKKEYVKVLRDKEIQDVRVFERREKKDVRNIVSLISSNSIFKTLYFDAKIQEEIIEFIKKEKIDIVHFESFYTGFYISDKIKELGVKQIFGTENIEYSIYKDFVQRHTSALLRPVFNHQLKNIKKEEDMMIKNSDMVLAVTSEEAKYIESVAPTPCVVIENGIDCKEFSFKKKEKVTKTILFVGNFTYFPNIEALKFLCTQILPKLEDKDLRFVMIGKDILKMTFLNDPRIEPHEYVEDIKKMYHSADIFLSPVSHGGGTNFKILEAMSCGTPVVADPIRLSGFGVKNNQEVLFTKTGEEFAKAIELLEKDKKLRETLSQSARDFVEEKFSWEIIGKKLQKAYEALK